MPLRARRRGPRAQFFGTRLAIMWMVGVPSAPGRCRVLYWFFTPSRDAPERLAKQAAEPDWKARPAPWLGLGYRVAGALEAVLSGLWAQLGRRATSFPTAVSSCSTPVCSTRAYAAGHM